MFLNDVTSPSKLACIVLGSAVSEEFERAVNVVGEEEDEDEDEDEEG